MRNRDRWFWAALLFGLVWTVFYGFNLDQTKYFLAANLWVALAYLIGSGDDQ